MLGIRKLLPGLALAALVALKAEASPLSNGAFATGDLTGWTTSTTANGTLGTPVVVAFDVTGTGVQNAVRLEAGEVTHTGEQAGGAIRQFVTVGGGTLTFHADIAAFAPFLNASAGAFTALLGGIAFASKTLGTIATSETLRDTLDFTTTLAAGTYALEILVTRPFLTSSGGTPVEYITNVSLAEASIAVPEPAGILALGIGLAGLGLVRRRA